MVVSWLEIVPRAEFHREGTMLVERQGIRSGSLGGENLAQEVP